MEKVDVDNLVVDDRAKGLFRVNRRVFTDPSILEFERREIFNKTWLYAAHESEIAGPGAYVSRTVAGRPIILARGDDGVVRAFFNACAHRANEVCRSASGKTKLFTCFYHAWSFNLKGELVGLPGPESYSQAFDRSAMGLVAVPRLEIYRGLIFISFDKDVMGLVEYLADAREYIDLMLDFGDGEVEIAPGSQSYSMKANWKLLVENSFDTYHALPTHGRYFGRFLNDIGIDNAAWKAVEPGETLGGRAIALGNGHALTENPGRVTPLQVKSAVELAEIRERLVKKYGAERAKRIADFNRNIFIFPNLIFIAFWRTIRTFYPVTPDYMEINAWCLTPKNDSPTLRQSRLENFISFLGPAGFGTPDDVAALEGCQRGFAGAADQPLWSDLSRGMHRERADSADELQMRTFWRGWKARMGGQREQPNYSDRVERASAAE